MNFLNNQKDMTDIVNSLLDSGHVSFASLDPDRDWQPDLTVFLIEIFEEVNSDKKSNKNIYSS